MSSIGLSFGERLADERPRSLTSAVQERLRADILSTRLLPGQKLHIAGLAKQFSVSLAAVREALSRLVADGLVQASDQRGFRVSPVSPADLRDVTQTRVDIEGLALRRSIERGDQEWLVIGGRSFRSALRRAVHSIRTIPTHHYEEWVVRHRVFHRTLVNACGSQWLLGFRDVLHEQSERYRRLSIRRDTEQSPATSRPSTRQSCMPCSNATPTPQSRRSRPISMTTMHLVELATPNASGSSDTV